MTLYLIFAPGNKPIYKKVAVEIYRLREQTQKAQLENAARDELRKRLADMYGLYAYQVFPLMLRFIQSHIRLTKKV